MSAFKKNMFTEVRDVLQTSAGVICKQARKGLSCAKALYDEQRQECSLRKEHQALGRLVESVASEKKEAADIFADEEIKASLDRIAELRRAFEQARSPAAEKASKAKAADAKGKEKQSAAPEKPAKKPGGAAKARPASPAAEAPVKAADKPSGKDPAAPKTASKKQAPGKKNP